MLLVAQNRKERQPSAALPQSILLEARFRRFRGSVLFRGERLRVETSLDRARG